MGPRVLTLDEATRLISKLEETFRKFDDLRERGRQIKVKITTLEVIWAERLTDASCPDHGEYTHHMESLDSINHEFAHLTEEIDELGGSVKGVDAGLVDFYSVKDGRLVLLCWQRGETQISFWHHIDDGFAGRQPLAVPAT